MIIFQYVGTGTEGPHVQEVTQQEQTNLRVTGAKGKTSVVLVPFSLHTNTFLSSNMLYLFHSTAYTFLTLSIADFTIFPVEWQLSQAQICIAKAILSVFQHMLVVSKTAQKQNLLKES